MKPQNSKKSESNTIKELYDYDDGKQYNIKVNPVTMVVTVEKVAEENDENILSIEKDRVRKHTHERKNIKKERDEPLFIIGLKKIFQKFKEGSNITITELMETLDEMGYNLSAEKSKEIQSLADIDGDGVMDVEEFVKLFLTMFIDIEDTEDDVIEAFQVFDYTNTDFIKTEQLRPILTNIGDSFTDQEMDAFGKIGDLDRDGSINYGELTRKMFVKYDIYKKKYHDAENSKKLLKKE